MEKDFKKMEIIFENCDAICLNEEDIDGLYMGDISLSYNVQGGTLRGYKTLSHMTMLLKPQVLNKHTQFAEMINDARELEYHKLKNRIYASDITQIYFYDADFNEIDKFFVYWNDDDEWHNRYQKQYITDEGYLVISIDKEEGN